MSHAALASAGITRITFLAKGYALVVAMIVFLSTSGCSVRHFAVNSMGDALAASGSGFGSDDDPELIGAAAPFSLKLMESVLAESPSHRGLLLAAAQGFVQYAYAFVEMRADELEDRDLQAAYAQRERARRLYLRARDYGLRGLETAHPGMARSLRADPAGAVARATEKDTSLLYWTGVAWAAAISLSKDDPFLIADLPVAEALVRRALTLEETYDHGAIHVFLITYEMSRAGMRAGAALKARAHFERAVELTSGRHAAPYVTLAEAVSIAEQNRGEFESLLQHALKLDTSGKPEWRLVNSVMQRRAHWLLDRANRFFSE